MKGMFKKFAALAAVVLFWSSQANALLIEIVPSDVGPITSGDTIDIDIIASDLGGDVVTAYQMLIDFDEALLTYDSAAFGCGLGECWFDSFVDAFEDSGMVDVSELSHLTADEILNHWSGFGLQDGSTPFTLFTLSFTANADALTTSFAFVWDVEQGYDVKWTDEALNPGYPTTVPEPGTLAWLALGRLGMAATRRRQKI